MIELDVQIAKALGYTYQREDGHYYRLYDPHGLLQATVGSRVGSVWHALIREGQEIGNVPRWSRDGGAMLTLITSKSCTLTMRTWTDKRVSVTVYDHGSKKTEPGKATDYNPVLAMARAWLQSQGVDLTGF